MPRERTYRATDGWADAFAACPRAAFLPEVVWPWDMATRSSVHVDRRTDPEGWRRWAEADVPLVTQWDDGVHPGPGPGTVATSSSSMPHVVADMLTDLDAEPGMRVLEIGTGTGWSTALLAHRLGERNVVSVEVDGAVASAARAHLREVGLRPPLLVGDGLLGHPAGAPYDRILATVGLRRIPHALIRQLRPGGVLLAPWGTDYAAQDALVRLTADGAGGASGPFLRPLEFMKARAQRTRWPRRAEYVPEDWSRAGPPRTTRLTPEDLGDTPFSPAEWALGLALPGVVHRIGHRTPEEASGWWYSLTDRSWAAVTWPPDGEPKVWEGGPRSLFAEVESAHRRWHDHGRPPHERYGLTLDDRGRPRTWLDTDAHPGADAAV